MPPYAFMDERALDYSDVEAWLKANRAVGVPYTDEMIQNAKVDLEAQVDPFSDIYDEFAARYPNAQIRDFDGDPRQISEMDAMIAYLQVLGTMVDFSTYEVETSR